MTNNNFKNAFIYHIYPLGMCGAEMNNNFKTNKERLEQIFDWVNYLKSFNVNAIYFGPLFESVSHGYDTVDYFKIDNRLGNNDLFSILVNHLKNNEVKTIIDGVFNHVSRDFFAFKDVLKNKKDSKCKDWFYINFNSNSKYNDGFYYEGWEGHYNLVKLNLRNPEVKEYIFSAVKYWIQNFDIDGLRLDVAYLLDKDFIKELKKICISLKPNFWIMGEVIHGDHSQILNIIDSTTNYECYKGIYSSHNDFNYFEISYSLNRLFGKDGIYKNKYLYNFVDNHDVNRAASTVKDIRHLYLMYIILFTMPGIPSMYYGSEVGIKGVKTNGNDSSLRPKISFNEIKRLCLNNPLFEHIKKLSDIRFNNSTLIYGDIEVVYTNNRQLIFSRYDSGNNYLILLNMDNEKIHIPLSKISSKYNGTYIDLLNNEMISTNDNEIFVHGNWGRILKNIS